MLNSYWAINLHDPDYGSVTSVAMSGNGRYIFTAGLDGNLFMLNTKNSSKENLNSPEICTNDINKNINIKIKNGTNNIDTEFNNKQIHSGDIERDLKPCIINDLPSTKNYRFCKCYYQILPSPFETFCFHYIDSMGVRSFDLKHKKTFQSQP